MKGSSLHWWTDKSALPNPGRALLIAVAPYSHVDVALLDVLEDALLERAGVSTRESLAVYVSNLQNYRTVEQLTKDIPNISEAPPQSPIVAVWENGVLAQSAWGKDARDLAANILGMSPESLDSQVLAKVPKYTPPRAFRA